MNKSLWVSLPKNQRRWEKEIRVNLGGGHQKVSQVKNGRKRVSGKQDGHRNHFKICAHTEFYSI